MHRYPRLSLEESGDRVFAHLSSVSAATKAQMAAACDMTPQQVQRGLDYVRDVWAGEESQPLIYTPRTKEYSFALLQSQADAYRQYRARVMAKQIRRLRTGTGSPALAKFGGPQLEYIDIQLGRIQEDLERLAR